MSGLARSKLFSVTPQLSRALISRGLGSLDNGRQLRATTRLPRQRALQDLISPALRPHCGPASGPCRSASSTPATDASTRKRHKTPTAFSVVPLNITGILTSPYPLRFGGLSEGPNRAMLSTGTARAAQWSLPPCSCLMVLRAGTVQARAKTPSAPRSQS